MRCAASQPDARLARSKIRLRAGSQSPTPSFPSLVAPAPGAQRRGAMRLAAALWLLAALASLHGGGAEDAVPAPVGPKPIKLTVDGIDATLEAMPADSYLLIEMFACAPYSPLR